MTEASPKAVADLIYRAGGRLVGRTKLQKSACPLEMAGLGYGFRFNYRLFGPYSDELQVACDDADALGLIKERKKSASWGGSYYAFESGESQLPAKPSVARTRSRLLKIAAEADPVELELAVTAAFLSSNGVATPWDKVAARKPAKATEMRMAKAKELYGKLLRVPTPKPLPKII